MRTVGNIDRERGGRVRGCTKCRWRPFSMVIKRKTKTRGFA